MIGNINKSDKEITVLICTSVIYCRKNITERVILVTNKNIDKIYKFSAIILIPRDIH
jgi:hypothetical protein